MNTTELARFGYDTPTDAPARRTRTSKPIVWPHSPRDRFRRYANQGVAVLRDIPQPSDKERAAARMHLVIMFLFFYGTGMLLLVLAQLSTAAAGIALVALFLVIPVAAFFRERWVPRR